MTPDNDSTHPYETNMTDAISTPTAQLKLAADTLTTDEHLEPTRNLAYDLEIVTLARNRTEHLPASSAVGGMADQVKN